MLGRFHRNAYIERLLLHSLCTVTHYTYTVFSLYWVFWKLLQISFDLRSQTHTRLALQYIVLPFANILYFTLYVVQIIMQYLTILFSSIIFVIYCQMNFLIFFLFIIQLLKINFRGKIHMIKKIMHYKIKTLSIYLCIYMKFVFARYFRNPAKISFICVNERKSDKEGRDMERFWEKHTHKTYLLNCKICYHCKLFINCWKSKKKLCMGDFW